MSGYKYRGACGLKGERSVMRGGDNSIGHPGFHNAHITEESHEDRDADQESEKKQKLTRAILSNRAVYSEPRYRITCQ